MDCEGRNAITDLVSFLLLDVNRIMRGSGSFSLRIHRGVNSRWFKSAGTVEVCLAGCVMKTYFIPGSLFSDHEVTFRLRIIVFAFRILNYSP